MPSVLARRSPTHARIVPWYEHTTAAAAAAVLRHPRGDQPRRRARHTHRRRRRRRSRTRGLGRTQGARGRRRAPPPREDRALQRSCGWGSWFPRTGHMLKLAGHLAPNVISMFHERLYRRTYITVQVLRGSETTLRGPQFRSAAART
jgi:hypothetical protein